MKTCKRCHKPVELFPRTLQGKLSTMCVRCFEDTRKRNAKKQMLAKDAASTSPEGMSVCMRCKKVKPSVEFNTDSRRNLAGDKLSRHCQSCRDYAKVKAISYRTEYTPEKTAHVSDRKKAKNREHRDLLYEAYGGACRCCGETVREFLAIDHVNNDGHEHRKIIGFGIHMLYLWAKKHNFPPSLQILCHNCNNAKAFYGVCPHQTQPILLVKNIA